MHRRALAPVLVSAALLLSSCTAMTESTVVTGPVTTTESTDLTTEEVALSGRLLGAAVIGVHRVDLPDGQTHEILGQADFQAGHTAALLVEQEGEALLHTAHLPLGPEALTVRGYRLDDAAQSSGPASEYSWPGTELANRVRALAVSPDGTRYAAVIADGPSTYLEVVDSRTDEVVFSGRDRADRMLGLVGDDLLWSQEHGLVYVADLGASPAGVAGGVVAVALEDLQRDSGEVSMSLLLGFDDEKWHGGRPAHLALSPDGTRLAYVWVPDGTNTHPDITAHVWAVGLTGSAEPRPLTAGSISVVGPVFSPDGQHLAVVEYSSRGTRNVYVVDAQGSFPTQFRGRLDTDAVVVATDTRVDTLLGWLPWLDGESRSGPRSMMAGPLPWAEAVVPHPSPSSAGALTPLRVVLVCRAGDHPEMLHRCQVGPRSETLATQDGCPRDGSGSDDRGHELQHDSESRLEEVGDGKVLQQDAEDDHGGAQTRGGADGRDAGEHVRQSQQP